jgi:hypothetical protein
MLRESPSLLSGLVGCLVPTQDKLNSHRLSCCALSTHQLKGNAGGPVSDMNPPNLATPLYKIRQQYLCIPQVCLTGKGEWITRHISHCEVK